MTTFKVEYEVSHFIGSPFVLVEIGDFDDIEDEDLEYAIGEVIQEHFEQNVSWHAKNRAEIIRQIIAARGGKGT